MLQRYRRRGLRVQGLQMHIVALRMQRHRGRHVVLRVSDRVVAGTVLGTAIRRRLPRDSVDAHDITLRRLPQGWRISAVRPVQR
jgi:hypothetical protein